MNSTIRIASLLAASMSVYSHQISTNAGQRGEGQPVTGRESLSLDIGWRFHLGDISPKEFRANGDEAEGGGKGASAWGAAAPGYDDRNWRSLNVPHDWVVELPFDKDAVRNQGYRKRGIGWYRKQFKLADSDRGKHLELQFDGIATHATVWFNGSLVGRNWNGYSSFQVDVTTMAHFGDRQNTIAIRVDADAMEGWWYEGGGIYRHTWLVKRSPVHIVTDGLYANPTKHEGDRWSIPVEVALENSGKERSRATVEASLFDPEGRRIASKKVQIWIKPLARQSASIDLGARSPALWSIERPNLYTVAASVVSDGQSDRVSTTCGFRTLRFDSKQGFLLNGRTLKIQGVCCHQDHAGVGVAVPDSLWEYRLRKLKEMGANAYRSSHNPPAKELLDACDRLGMLVMDENRHFNTSEECLGQLRWLVRRDRNHPSVALWSLFNEENALQGTEQGEQMARRMTLAIKELDSTRPITAAQNGGLLVDGKVNPHNAAMAVDVVGINYQVDLYDKIRAAYPDKPMLSSEDTSQVMTRGAFETDWNKLVLASYDDKYPGWASDNRGAWLAIARQPSFAGGFIWTGFDYRGEPSPFGWPAVSSYFGCMDLCGFPKTAFYIRQALWVRDRPVLTLLPHWNWSGKEGVPVRVIALSNADSVALYLNGKSIGSKSVDASGMVEWQVPYAQGQLEAVATKSGKNVARTTVETTGDPVGLRLVPDRNFLHGDGADAMPVTIEAIDARGRAVPTANLLVEFEVAGAGSILGVGNGDPTSHESETAPRCRLFNGLAQVIVQSKRRDGASMKLTARAKGLAAAELTIEVKSGLPLPTLKDH